MNRLSFLIFFNFLIYSCGQLDKDRIVDQKKLLADDYRLFQNTPAWELARAVRDEDFSTIAKIVAQDPSLLDYQDPKFGGTLLMLTIRNQQIKSFQALLEKNADVHVHDEYDGTSALILACSDKGYDISYAKRLIEFGANVNDIEIGERRVGNSTRETPLIASSKQGSLNLVKLLIEKGAEVNYQNEFGHTALAKAIMTDNYEVALYLLKVEADYTLPIFYRPNNNRQMYLVDVLREDFFDLRSQEYKRKMEIVDFLKSKGIDYRKSPIPDFIIEKAKQKYPNKWKYFLDNY
jgi:hypothetical protein